MFLIIVFIRFSFTITASVIVRWGWLVVVMWITHVMMGYERVDWLFNLLNFIWWHQHTQHNYPKYIIYIIYLGELCCVGLVCVDVFRRWLIQPISHQVINSHIAHHPVCKLFFSLTSQLTSPHYDGRCDIKWKSDEDNYRKHHKWTWFKATNSSSSPCYAKTCMFKLIYIHVDANRKWW